MTHTLFIVQNQTVPFDRRVWAEALATKRFGFAVTIISPKNKEAKEEYQVIDGIEIYRYPSWSGGNSKISFVLEYLNAFLWELYLSFRVYTHKPFQIIHGANPPDNIFLIALIYRLLFGVKYIFDHHDLSPELYLTRFSGKKDWVYRILILLEKFSCEGADAVVSTNESYRQIVLERHHLNPSKIFVVRNDPSKGEMRKHRKGYLKRKVTKEKKKVLLYLGCINPQDGVDLLLVALSYLVDDLGEKNFVCYVLGDGDSLETAKRRARHLNLNPYVIFKGFIFDKNSVRQYLSLADVCLEPAPHNELNKHSTFIKVMEYMAAGKPIVAFDLNETRYSTDGAALLVGWDDIVGFAKAIKRLMDDPALAEQIGNRGLERVQKRFNWENASAKLREVYAQCASVHSIK